MPTIESITGDTEVNEGIPATFNAIATDPGDDTLTYTWDFGDGTQQSTVNSQQSTVEHIYSDNGEYTVTLTVTDSDGSSISESLAVAVSNVAPVITQATGDTRIDEGGRASFNAIATDAGDDELTYTWNLGNNNLATGQSVEDIYLDNGVYEVTLTVSDGDGGVASSNLTITVDNVAPAIASIEDRSSDEGSTVEFDFSFSDPGILDTHTVVWDFGDETKPVTLDSDATTVSHIYTDNGQYTATLTVTDNDGASTTETVDVTVNNVAPTFTIVNGRTNVNEGEVVNYSATATDPGDDDLTYTWSFNNGASEVELADINHVFAQDGVYDAIVTVTDDDGSSDRNRFLVTVNNVAPNIETAPTASGNEGSNVELVATFSDPGTDALSITWDFGDGSEPVTTNYDDSPTPFELKVAHTYAQDGIYNAIVTVTDSDGAVTNSTVEVTINNVAPTVERLSGDTVINEGDTATFNAIASDPGADELTYTWDFGDGTEPVVIVNDDSPVSHTYSDNGEYTVTLTVTDPSGAEATQSVEVTVNNVAPTITQVTGDTPIDEGSTANFNAIATDPGNDTLTYTWSFPDGRELTGEAVSKIFIESGEYNVNLTVADSDGGATEQTLTIQVENVTPIVAPLSDRTSDEGSPVGFNASFSDPGVLDTHTIEWNFGDGATATDTLTPTHTYSDNGEYQVALTVTDDEEAATTVNLTVTVNNVAPTITQATGDTSVDEGSVANFSATATDPGADELTYSWNFGDGSEPQIGESVAHTYADDGEYDVTLTVTDDDGGVTTENLTIRVDNVAPTIDRVEFAPPAEGRASQFKAIATDPGEDTITYTWDFGDGSESVTGSTVEHLYLDDGDYTITLTTRDEDGGVTTSSFAVAVEQVFNLKAEGKIRINGRSDLGGEPLNVDDDTRIYAGGGFTINGNQTLPVQRDSNDDVIKQGRKSVLVDRAVTVGPDYSESKANASRNQYVGIVPPQVIDELSVNVPQHTTLIDSELATKVAPGTTPITFDPQQNPLNNARDWSDKFPAPGTAGRPTVVTIANGGLNIPSGVALSNYVITVEQGDINFDSKGHDLDNVVLINRNGSINLASVRSNNLSVFAANKIDIDSPARFGGDTIVATGNRDSNLNFNGVSDTLDERSNLEVISQGDITFNSSSTTKGNFTAAKNFTANGRSSIIGSIQTKGDIRINGGIDLRQ